MCPKVVMRSEGTSSYLGRVDGRFKSWIDPDPASGLHATTEGGSAPASAPGTEPRPPRRTRADDATAAKRRAAACARPRHAAVDSAATHGRASHVSGEWGAEPGGQGGVRHRARPALARRGVSELLRSRAKAGTRLRCAQARRVGAHALCVCPEDSNRGLADARQACLSHVKILFCTARRSAC